ncbi:MarR family winged helix-turn-helix transcriptional regulator [Pseudactinotalea sp. HY158]|uniref:MarR family winged helix-turn-helix transcriptional regulator n=1 Tax=Pseudactinotalea sp. HY158 TaxID=2654547 RepID=UPI00129C9AC7|nr:MarR family transcriptional regulator [Pseudactinotalea sp. HY158]QGH70206.1 MarR family transcriptional regulator [Pseudactinotalea sp. HY158]
MSDGPADAGATRAYPPPETWPTGRLLSAAARRVERAWDDYLEQWSLTHASLPVLVILTGGPLSQREIAGQMHVSEQSVGRVLGGLERAGHLTRSAHPEDRRRRVVTLTDSGRTALERLDHLRNVESLLGDSLSAAEVDQLRRLLIRMVAHFPKEEDR